MSSIPYQLASQGYDLFKSLYHHRSELPQSKRDPIDLSLDFLLERATRDSNDALDFAKAHLYQVASAAVESAESGCDASGKFILPTYEEQLEQALEDLRCVEGLIRGLRCTTENWALMANEFVDVK